MLCHDKIKRKKKGTLSRKSFYVTTYHLSVNTVRHERNIITAKKKKTLCRDNYKTNSVELCRDIFKVCYDILQNKKV